MGDIVTITQTQRFTSAPRRSPPGATSVAQEFRQLVQRALSSLRVCRRDVQGPDAVHLAHLIDSASAALDEASVLAHKLAASPAAGPAAGGVRPFGS